jgi:phage protein U
MGQVGYFGSERFVVSDTKVFTFSDFQRTTASRYETFDRIGKKPLTEMVGYGLDAITYSVALDVSLGVEPRTVLDHWSTLANVGTVDVLVVGNKLVGKNRWLLKSVAESWSKISGTGRILAATMNLTFEEYMLT